jgi:alginate O-acetyltransferase complex protein AlgI
MVFQSLDYLVFFLAVFTAYWALPRLGQNVLLLAASYFFYGYVHPWYCLLIAATTLVDWFSARRIAAGGGGRRRWLAASLVVNFTILGVFKYFGFFVDNAIAAAAAIGLDLDHPHWRILLPVGISFYTFQSASYVVDVFRGREQARGNLLDYALFVSFFPQLVAGPIERAGNLLAQVERRRIFDPFAARPAVILILWGLFQKKCIADNAAVIANKVFALEQNSFPILWAGVLAFGVQIYADFSAYTNIARGSARLFGFELRPNFNHPYLADSPADFWRRWHISLSTWFRDYVYIPLGGGRGGAASTMRNIFITFGLSGLWHGANWNFVIWGLFHGALVAGWHLLESRRPGWATGGGRAGRLARVALTFALVHVGWLMFREQDIGQLLRAFTLSPLASRMAWEAGLFLAAQALLWSLPMWLLPLVERRAGPGGERLPDLRGYPRAALDGAVAALLVAGILLFTSPTASDFIYFQF